MFILQQTQKKLKARIKLKRVQDFPESILKWNCDSEKMTLYFSKIRFSTQSIIFEAT